MEKVIKTKHQSKNSITVHQGFKEYIWYQVQQMPLIVFALRPFASDNISRFIIHINGNTGFTNYTMKYVDYCITYT